MSETIPPSLVLITIGSVTGVSIAALFTGGLLPGLVLAIALGVVAWWRSRGEAVGERAARREIGRTFVIALPALLLPFVIRSAVVEGVATATEVSTIGIAYAVRLRPADLPPVRLEAALSDAARDGLPVGRDPADHRHRHRHGLGADPVGLLAPARARRWRRCRAAASAS